MADHDDVDLTRAVGVTSVQAWRGTFAGDPEPDGTPFSFDAVVIEFGVDVGAIPPLFVPVEAVAGLAEVLVQAANGPNADGSAGAADLAPATPVAAAEVADVGGDEWAGLLAQPRFAVAGLDRADVPALPGVCAWFRHGVPVHLGRATGKRGLRARVGSDHLLTDADLTRSALRRAVADHLGLATATADDGAVTVAPDAAAKLDAWIAGCEVGWLACATPELALDLEAALLLEHRPELAPADG